MLDPEYLLHVSEGAEEIAETLHTDIVNRIVERIMIRIGRGDNYILTPVDKWQLEVLRDAGYLLEDIKKEISKRTKLQQIEIAEAMKEAGVRAMAYDDAIYKSAGLYPTPLIQSPHLMRLMQRNYEKTIGEWNNFTGTLAEATQKEFIKAVDKAYTLTTYGTVSYTQAVKEALNDVISDGVVVTYPSGHKDTIETATLRAVRTGISQATGDITLARMEEMDWDIILVSSHLGARVTGKEDFTDHAWWQGKFYSRTGRDPRFPNFSVCGYGNVQGIGGANCRHPFGPGDGEFNPYTQYDSEENKKAYELSQRQRTMERSIRDAKRQCMNWKTAVDNAEKPDVKAMAEANYQKKAAVLKKRNARYNQFCKDNNLKRRAERISIAKWDRKQAAAATGAARRYENKVDQVQSKPD